ncbi:MAG TPA: serine hydrolase domain-containing protein [Telluria sp.]|nr:serine hydrolase domain-containing protein [Telluria sp.]
MHMPPPPAVDQYMEQQMARFHIPGAAVAVVQDGQIVKLAVYGKANLEQDTPVTPHSAFQIASSTKLLTSLALMQLVAEGKIELDAPVSRYVADTPASWNGMTVRQLAAHASGLKPGPFPASAHTTDDAVELARKQTLAAKPGAVSAYGSLDFSVLANIMEKVSGKSYEQLIADRVAAPLGMTVRFDHTSVTPDGSRMNADIVPNRVVTYRPGANGLQSYRFLYPAYTYAAGGAYTSIEDMAHLLQGVMAHKLVPAALDETMWKPYRLNDGKDASFAVCWTVSTYRGERQVGHSGGPALSDVVYYPARKLGIVVLTNQFKLVPNLAHGVANFYLPPVKGLNDPGIADADPARTASVQAALAALKEGKAQAAQFSGPAKEQLADLNEWLPLQTGSLPELSRLVLLDETADRTRRTYRAVYGADQTLRWVVRFDQQGLISDIDAADE